VQQNYYEQRRPPQALPSTNTNPYLLSCVFLVLNYFFFFFFSVLPALENQSGEQQAALIQKLRADGQREVEKVERKAALQVKQLESQSKLSESKAEAASKKAVLALDKAEAR
jgi:hypothetical protein